MIVTGVGQVGCIPYELARYNGTTNRCNENINSAISLFNSGVRKLVERFNKGELQGAKFVYFDSFKATNDLIANAQSYGTLNNILYSCYS